MIQFENKSRSTVIASVIVAFAIIAWMFYPSIENMVRYWLGHEEFGHAFFLPLISFYLIWQKRFELCGLPIRKTWAGLLIVFLGVVLFILGNLSAIFIIQQYSLALVLIGLFVSIFGLEIAKKVTIPLALLFFMIPLPGFLYNSLSGELQLISSQIGVFIIRLFDISVYLEGNVIDLGVYKLQVVEACSGLRYLFPLMTLGLIASYIYNASVLNKSIVFLSTIPITVFMNSFRIGMIGVLVEYYGIAMAEGFLHDFEGWIIFMACMVVLIFEMWLLNKVSKHKRPFSEMFNLEVIESDENVENKQTIIYPSTIIFVIPILLAGFLVTMMSENRSEVIPERQDFTHFPNEISDYTGEKGSFEKAIINALNFDDYLIANYKRENQPYVYNLYVGYYNTQRADKVPHSPKACLPGGGWLITNSDVVNFAAGNKNISANRVVIHQGDSKQLVYYWFKQRNRIITNEYLVKWYLLIDAISINRTDGALVRFVTSMQKNEGLDKAENRLREFISQVNPLISEYVPD